MYARVKSLVNVGLKVYDILVEVDISSGLPSFTIVGLPDTSIQEAKERVRAAIKNSGFEFPVRKITVNLAPGEIKKEGTLFDLPISIGILTASGQINQEIVEKYYFVGELTLEGELGKINGGLSLSLFLKEKEEPLIIPQKNLYECALSKETKLIPFRNLSEVVLFLRGEIQKDIIKNYPVEFSEENFDIDFSDVKGQTFVKRAMEISAAGRHHLIMVGAPGSGKTMLSQRMITIMPELSFDEAVEITEIYSIAGILKEDEEIIKRRPFRSPHHTISYAGLVGGGTNPKPGEISLAHKGILFLDELPEFRRDVLEVLRQPIEEGFVTISRVKTSLTYPSDFLLIGAMNPCPCGYFGDSEKNCTCSLSEIKRYRSKISGPLWDRFDIKIKVPRVKENEVFSKESGESSKVIRERVKRAWEIQKDRYKNEKVKFNGKLTPMLIKKYIPITQDGENTLKNALKTLNLTLRSFHKIIKLARTIADLEGNEKVNTSHLLEAISYQRYGLMDEI
ncbi:MAG: YifB family Mg chelatase-like AAA ATPase [Caldisericia bacterium]|nr:YifB family Mg chelatase-like AAA ATPase [Caldisericia bacterium]